ncbi:MAG: gamma-glutamyltransferase [Gammaproteobacteria bacterium]|nr:gamma-glutamyltransferase [Gammaproteobacteria bacterium]
MICLQDCFTGVSKNATFMVANLRAAFCRYLTVTILVLGVVATTSVKSNTVVVENAAVSSRSMLASEAGVEAMRNGGNAVDAAVSTAFTLAVTYPSAGNLGGGGFAVIRMPDGKVFTNDHRERAPKNATRDMFLDEAGEYVAERALRSHLASGVPGSVAGLLAIHERFGVLSRESVVAPAIELAREGFELPADIARQFSSRHEWFQHIDSTRKVFYKEDGSFYQAGELFKQPDLAATLSRVSEQGRDGFYKGETADLIEAEMSRGGGLISKSDLEAYESVWREPIHGRYRGYDIHSMPPPSSGGVLVVQLLNMLEPFELGELGFHTAPSMHLMIEAERRAYADRALHLGDPDFYPVPLDTLLSKRYARSRIENIGATATTSDDVDAGSIPKEPFETTHFSVIDADGMAVAFTTTINGGYGSGIIVEGAGFLLNNEMDDFSAKPGTPNMFGLIGGEANAIEPGKRMLSSMTPTIVSKGNRFILITGSPGGSTIITTTLQVILNVIDHGFELEEAVNAPRFHHQWRPNSVRFEAGIEQDVIDELSAMGHTDLNRLPERFAIGDANSILKFRGSITTTSDGRNEGGAVGF